MWNTAHGPAVSRLQDCGGSSILSSSSASRYWLFKVGLHHVKTDIKGKEKQKMSLTVVGGSDHVPSCLGVFRCLLFRCCCLGVVTVCRVQLSNIYKYFSNGVSSVGANPRHLFDSGIPGLTLCYRNFSTRDLESLRIWWAFCIMRSLTSCTADDLVA